MYEGLGSEAGKYVVLVDSGIDFQKGTSDATGSELNKVIWTTSNGARVTHVYIAQEPSVDILLNGYDAGSPAEPLLDPVDASSVDARDSNYDYPYD